MIEHEALRGPGISHGFFTRGGGHSTGIFSSLNCGFGSGDDADLVRMNRETVTRAMNVDVDRLATVHQVHSAEAVNAVAAWPLDERPKADGLVTTQRGLALGVLSADCGPLLFADHKSGVIGACHAGWKGALTGIAEATVMEMERQGATRAGIVAVIGPMISQSAYEVGPEFPKPFIEQNAAHAKFFVPSTKQGHLMFDLPGCLVARLKAFGVGTVHDLTLCTYLDEARFYSYRRATHRGEQHYGRLISAIALL